MAWVNFGQLFFTNSMKVKDNKKHHKVHIIIYYNLFSYLARLALRGVKPELGFYRNFSVI